MPSPLSPASPSGSSSPTLASSRRDSSATNNNTLAFALSHDSATTVRSIAAASVDTLHPANLPLPPSHQHQQPQRAASSSPRVPSAAAAARSQRSDGSRTRQPLEMLDVVGDDGERDETERDELERPEKMLSRAGVRWFMTQVFFHNTIIGLVILDLVLVFADIILSINTACIPKHDPLNPTAPYHCRPTIEPSKALSTGKQAINTTSIALLVIFSIEILFSMFAMGRHFFASTIHIVDAVAVFASLGLEFYSQYGGVIIVLRIWKMFRIIHAISHALDLHNRTLVRRMKRTNIAILRASSTLHADLIAERDRLAAMAKRVAAAGTETAAGGMDAVVYDLREAQKRLSRAVRRAETTLGAELNEEDMVAYGLMEPPAEKPPARGLTLKRGKGRS